MTDTTTFPGLVSIDPIAGLIGYVQDIKPYHTKVFETLVEYVYTDYVNVNIVDRNVLAIDMVEADALNPTINEDGDLSVPTSITEMFDFFITAPIPGTATLSSTNVATEIVSFTGNITSDFQIGDLIVITGSATGNNGKYLLLTIGYDNTTTKTNITLNSLSGINGTTGTVTIYHTDTTYSFVFPIQSAVVGPIVVTEPVTGTIFNVSTITVPGNATRAIQAGSIFQAVPTLPPTITPHLYHAAFVQFIPSFNTDGSRNPPGDVTVIGVELDAVFTDAVINTGFVIPYNITGYDDRYDAPYDGMAGYRIISG